MTIPRFWREIEQRYRGIGVECENCNRVYFPPREICPHCRRESFGKMKERELSGRGKILTYTEVHDPHPDFKMLTPYIMAIIEMEEDVRITGHLVDVDYDEVEPGMEVKTTMRRLGQESPEGIIYYGYKFVPVREKND
ncbi:MAG: Zn-ribbon domain-containing OB-fold protein [Candidatus Saliniplasma sp.]